MGSLILSRTTTFAFRSTSLLRDVPEPLLRFSRNTINNTNNIGLTREQLLQIQDIDSDLRTITSDMPAPDPSDTTVSEDSDIVEPIPVQAYTVPDELPPLEAVRVAKKGGG